MKKVLNMLVIPCWCTPFSGESGDAWREELLDTSSDPELGDEMSLDLTRTSNNQVRAAGRLNE